VAEQVDGLGHANVVVEPGEQVADVGAGLRDAEQARFVLDEVVSISMYRPSGRPRARTGPQVDEVGAALAAPGPATRASSSTRKVYERPWKP
jgi:hypothetical protein